MAIRKTYSKAFKIEAEIDEIQHSIVTQAVADIRRQHHGTVIVIAENGKTEPVEKPTRPLHIPRCP